MQQKQPHTESSPLLFSHTQAHQSDKKKTPSSASAPFRYTRRRRRHNSFELPPPPPRHPNMHVQMSTSSRDSDDDSSSNSSIAPSPTSSHQPSSKANSSSALPALGSSDRVQDQSQPKLEKWQENLQGDALAPSVVETALNLPSTAQSHPETSTDELLGLWDYEHPEQAVESMKRRFLLHLVVALHSYGNTTHRTEFLVTEVAAALNIRVDVGAFPNFCLVSFIASDGDPTKSELHHLPVSSGLDLDKLGRMDNLCQVGVELCKRWHM